MATASARTSDHGTTGTSFMTIKISVVSSSFTWPSLPDPLHPSCDPQRAVLIPTPPGTQVRFIQVWKQTFCFTPWIWECCVILGGYHDAHDMETQSRAFKVTWAGLFPWLATWISKKTVDAVEPPTIACQPASTAVQNKGLKSKKSLWKSDLASINTGCLASASLLRCQRKSCPRLDVPQVLIPWRQTDMMTLTSEVNHY